MIIYSSMLYIDIPYAFQLEVLLITCISSFICSDLIDQFIGKDLKQPSKGVTYVQHLYTFFWQYAQYSVLKDTLQPDEALIVEDFAENRKATYSVEVIIFNTLYCSLPAHCNLTLQSAFFPRDLILNNGFPQYFMSYIYIYLMSTD